MVWKIIQFDQNYWGEKRKKIVAIYENEDEIEVSHCVVVHANEGARKSRLEMPKEAEL